MKPNLALSVSNLSAPLAGRMILDGLDIEVQSGEVVAIFGHNGAGKSTLLRCIIGAVRTSGGKIQCGFVRWRRDPHAMAKAGISYLPQSRKLFSSLTVRDNLLVYSEAIGQQRSSFDQNYRDLADQFHILKDAESVPSGQLSGGQVQQVAIARALLSDAHLLLLDEPTIGLAPQLRRQTFAAISSFAKDRNCAVLIAEHQIVETLMFAHRAYVIREGKVVLSGEAAELSRDEEKLQRAIM